MKFEAQLQTGERLWLGDVRNPKRRLVRVVKTTPTQIVAMLGNLEKRYNRKNGREIGGTFISMYLTGIALQSEIAEFEINERKQSEEFRERQQKTEAADAKRAELRNLFSEFESKTGNVVSISQGMNESGKWEVTLDGLDESQVRRLAVIMNAQATKA